MDKRNMLEIFALISIIIISGTRDYTGYDYQTYSEAYDNFHHDESFEVGFVGFMNILRFFKLSSYSMFFLMSIATYVFTYLGIKKYTTHTGIALIIFLLIPGLYLNSLSIVRQSFAIAVAFYAFSFLLEKKYTKYFLLMLLGIAFHYSCGVLIIFHFLSGKISDKLKVTHYIVAIVGSLIVAKLNITTILAPILGGSKYELHLEGESISFGKILILNLFLFVLLAFYQKIINKSRINAHMMFFTTLAIILINCFSSLIVITRIAYYFRIFEIILIAEFIYIFNKRSRSLVLLVTYLYYFGVFYISLLNDIKAPIPEPKLIPYKNIFF